MFRAAKNGAIAVALTASVFTFTAGPAEAVTDFRNCDHMHRTYKNGVAKSRAAARRQVRTGHFRPAVRPKVYRANNESDADNDRTACEVSR
jgi:Excalibur calcium-binding domain